MPVILSIGYSHYLVQSKKEAASILTALCGAVKLDHSYVDREEVYFPDNRQTEVSMKTIRPEQLLRSKPPEKDEFIEQPAPKVPRQLGF